MSDLSTLAIDILLLSLLVCTALAIVRMRELWAVVMLTGLYSFLGAGWMMVLDAPDVAFTEAAVGAGISTVLMLSTLALTSKEMKRPAAAPYVPLAVVTITGAALIYGTFDMPRYGDPDAPVHQYPSPSYITKAAEEIQTPNVVTAVLASYRGYDTLGETVVIFTAGISVLLLLRPRTFRFDAGRQGPGPPIGDGGRPRSAAAPETGTAQGDDATSSQPQVDS